MKHGAILAAILLAGCAAQRGNYPSLAHRPIENGNFDEPVRAAAALTPDPALDGRIASMSASLAEATAAFDKMLPAATKRAEAARGQAAGSEAWVDAQQALSPLDDGRATVAALATTANDAASERAARLLPPYPTLDALTERIDAELARERTAIERLQAMLAPG